MGRCGEVWGGPVRVGDDHRGSEDHTDIWGARHRDAAGPQTTPAMCLPPQALKHGGIAGMINELAH